LTGHRGHQSLSAAANLAHLGTCTSLIVS